MPRTARQCTICGGTFVKLSNHLGDVHKIRGKKRTELLQEARRVCPDPRRTRERRPKRVERTCPICKVTTARYVFIIEQHAQQQVLKYLVSTQTISYGEIVWPTKHHWFVHAFTAITHRNLLLHSQLYIIQRPHPLMSTKIVDNLG